MTVETTHPPRAPNVVLDRLRSTFPVFLECRVLAIGIHTSIMERLPDISKTQLRAALKTHTASNRYLKALSQGKDRFDLDGKPDGMVTLEQRQQATEILRERFRKGAEQRKIQQREKQQQEKLLKLAEKFNTRAT